MGLTPAHRSGAEGPRAPPSLVPSPGWARRLLRACGALSLDPDVDFLWPWVEGRHQELPEGPAQPRPGGVGITELGGPSSLSSSLPWWGGVQSERVTMVPGVGPQEQGGCPTEQGQKLVLARAGRLGCPLLEHFSVSSAGQAWRLQGTTSLPSAIDGECGSERALLSPLWSVHTCGRDHPEGHTVSQEGGGSRPHFPLEVRGHVASDASPLCRDG